MTKRSRRNHSGSFKAKVAVAALRGDKTLTEIAEQYQVHPTQVTEWKRQLLDPTAPDRYQPAKPGLCRGYYIHPNEARLRLSVCRDGLG
jgi:transposase-like protein